ncbi:MAG: hypothetical protein E3J25_04985 [Anaerolineales bacterium]|nr:MAG: hypothetical protein E3J25_04985 [Anaerolineales bacterium]
MPVAVPKNVRLHQILFEEWDVTVNSGTLNNITDGPGYTDFDVTGLTSIDFTRPIRDSQGKALRDGNYLHQLIYLKLFNADIPAGAGVMAVTAGLAEGDISSAVRGGPRYNVTTDRWSSVMVALGASGLNEIATGSLTWAESLQSQIMMPDGTVHSQETVYVRVSDAQTISSTKTNSSGSIADPVQIVRVVVQATGVLRVHAGIAAIQINHTARARTTYRQVKATECTLVSGSGTIADTGDGELSVTGSTNPIWSFPLSGMGTLGADEVVMFGAVVDYNASFRVVIGLEDGVSTPFGAGMATDGRVYCNGVSGTVPTDPIVGAAWGEHLSDWHNMGILYGQSYAADGGWQNQRGATNSVMLTGGTLLGRLSVLGDSTYRVGYWFTGPIPLEIVPRG